MRPAVHRAAVYPRHACPAEHIRRPQEAVHGAETRRRGKPTQQRTVRRVEANAGEGGHDEGMPVLAVLLLTEHQEREAVPVAETVVVLHHGPGKLAHSGGVANDQSPQRDVRGRPLPADQDFRQRTLRHHVGRHHSRAHARRVLFQIDRQGVQVDAHEAVVVGLPGGFGLKTILQAGLQSPVHGQDVGPLHALQHLCVRPRVLDGSGDAADNLLSATDKVDQIAHPPGKLVIPNITFTHRHSDLTKLI